MRGWWAIAFLSALVALGGCGGSSSPVDGGEDGALDGGGDGGDAGGDPGTVFVELAVFPEAIELEEGMSERLRADGVEASGRRTEVTGQVSWSIAAPSLVAIEAAVLTGLAPGETEVRAVLGSLESQPVPVTVRPHADFEARGVWVTRWNFSSAADIETVVAHLAEAGCNQIYFQVRGTADAYYQSQFEPWAAGLSGTLGEDPGWDPLQVAIDAAHAAGLEVHAWLNTYPAWNCSAALPQSAGIPHVLETHPEWVCADSAGTSMLGTCSSGYVTLSPGVPEVRAHIRDVALDIATHYDVDGIHLDYIRYPGPGYSHDAASEAEYAAAEAAEPGLTWADWQRRQVDQLVADIHEGLQVERPDVVLSAAVWFIYRNVWGWSAVSQGYTDYYQDPRAWAAAGTIDAVAPMIYFPLTDPPGERLDFAAMLEDAVAGMGDRFVYAGIHADYDSFDEIAAEIEATRALGGRGFVLFAYTYLVNHAYWDELGSALAQPAPPPGMPWKQ